MTHSVNRRLDSWKEIAEYLGRDIRTVIRWEKEKCLPIRRIPGGKRPAVFAYTQEIQTWMVGQDVADEQAAASPPPFGTDQPAARDASEPPAEAASPRRRPLRYRAALGVAATLVLLAGVALVANRVQHAGPRLPALQRPLQFGRADYSVGAPRGIVVGDFNSDQRLDLAVTDSRNGQVVVLLGDGHGAFPSRVVTRTSIKAPEHIAAGDFDGDGRLDIVVTSFYGSSVVEVLRGNGDGSFRPGAQLDAGGRSRWVAVGDVNGDSRPDLIVAASLAGKLIVKFGHGDGTFADGGEYEAEQDVAALALADVNRDGWLDVIASDYRTATGNSVSIYLNRGDGTLAPRRRFTTGSGPLGLAVADLNHDGVLDIVTANFPKKCSVLLGRVGVQFAEPVDFEADGSNGFVEVADLDRDGQPDVIVLGEHSNTARILMGDGHGHLAFAQDVPTGRYPDGVVVADFDGDQRLDMAVVNIESDSVSVYVNQTQTSLFRGWLASIFSIHVN